MPSATKQLKYFMRPEGPKGYTTREQVENYLLINIDASFHSQVNDWIMEVEEYIDRKTGRNFVADTGDVLRVFDGDGTCKQIIDDCVEISKLEVGRDTVTEVDAANFVTYPLNARKLSRAVPITRIELLGAVFPRYPQIVRVTGKWGYSIHPPTDIRMAATVLVAGIINYAWNSEGEVKTMTIGRYSVTYKDEKQWQDFEKIDGAKGILETYRKFTF